MKRVNRDASLHPATVSDAARIIAEQRRPRRVSAPVNGPVRTSTVDERVWQTALDLCHGVLTRIERVSPTEVIVHNNPR